MSKLELVFNPQTKEEILNNINYYKEKISNYSNNEDIYEELRLLYQLLSWKE